MDQLETSLKRAENLLPEGGEVYYLGKILTSSEAEKYFKTLLETIAWKNDEARIFGKHFITKRKAAWYGDKPFAYTYSNATKQALTWTPELLELKKLVEHKTGATFNSCLLNLYHTGEESMAWHSDDEKALGRQPVIASISLGAERKFAFKHKKTKEVISLLLAPGSLLLMQGETQANWWHRLPPTKKVSEARINLTFRTFFE